LKVESADAGKPNVENDAAGAVLRARVEKLATTAFSFVAASPAQTKADMIILLVRTLAVYAIRKSTDAITLEAWG
jgi:hypothetical protein